MDNEFVIQIHSGHGPLHYDLMLSPDADSPLATWSLPASPADLPAGQGLSARKLPDHRRAYLTYQGPVSGDRGRVEILDRGRYRTIARHARRWVFELQGRRIVGRFELLAHGDGDAWVLHRHTEGPTINDPAGSAQE